MKILFALSDTGGGHRSAAIAINDAVNLLAANADEPVECTMIDILKATDFPLLRDAPTMYNELSTRWLSFYNLAFRLTDGSLQITLLTYLVVWWSGRNLLRAIQEVNPDIIVITHPLTVRILCLLRERYPEIACPLFTVITDLVSLHTSWLYPKIDHYLIPTNEAAAIAKRRGVPTDRIQRTGFPVNPKFTHYERSQAETRRALGIDLDRTTVLITGGGVGSGRMMKDLVLRLEETFPEVQFLVVTAKNRALYDELQQAKQHAHTHIYGFVTNMEELMAASEVVVTKAGPGTIMEALVMRRPVLVTEAVGLQEQGNIDFVVNNRLGYFCPTIEKIVESLGVLIEPDAYAETVARLNDSIPRDGGIQIAKAVLAHCGVATPDDVVEVTS